MAGEWIKVRTNLWDDPRIGQLCELTDQGEAAIIGGLYWLWATADEHSSDGLLHGMTTRTIDRKTGVQGLGKALVTIGWLAEADDGVKLVRFDEHNGESAKARAQGAKRQSKYRSNGGVTQLALLERDEAVTGALPREDKNKKEEPPKPPKGGPVEPQPAEKRGVRLQTFLDDCKAKNERPLRDYQPLWAYCDSAKLPKDFVALAWVEFCRRFTGDGTDVATLQKDWRRKFQKYVQGNYFKLWAMGPEGEYFLTTQGKQAQNVHMEKAA